MSGLRLHPREKIVREAEMHLSSALVEMGEKYDLTFGERLRVVQAVLGNDIAGMAKHAIREERHPDDPDRPGGRASDKDSAPGEPV